METPRPGLGGSRSGRRALILTASMGSGHVSVGLELAARLRSRGYRTRLADVHDLMPRPAGQWIAGFYFWTLRRAPWVYQAIFQAFFKHPQERGERVRIPVQLALPGLRRLVASFEPDVVVSTYHIAGLAAAELRGRGALGCPVISFVPTFGVHELWMHPDIDGYLCISASVADYLASRTQRPTRTCGPLVRSAFLSPDGRSGHEPLPVEIPQAVRSALVVGGSLGIGDMLRAARGVTSMPGWMAVAVCGRNEQLRGQMERVPGCTALGWVEDMAGLMRVCDVLIDNAGGLSSKEALAAGLPVVTFRPIPGHGRDDALQMQRLGLTEVVEDEGDLVAALTRLAGSPAERRRRSRRGRSLFVADAAAELEELIRITERPRVAVPHAIRRGPRPLPSRRLTG